MANRERGEVGFEAIGKSWTLKGGTNAICEIEDATGMGIAAVGEQLSEPKRMTLKLVRAAFWGLLRTNHEVSLAEAGEIIDDIGTQRAGELIGEAFEKAFPKAKAGEARPLKATAE